MCVHWTVTKHSVLCSKRFTAADLFEVMALPSMQLWQNEEEEAKAKCCAYSFHRTSSLKNSSAPVSCKGRQQVHVSSYSRVAAETKRIRVNITSTIYYEGTISLA